MAVSRFVGPSKHRQPVALLPPRRAERAGVLHGQSSRSVDESPQ